MGFSEIIGAILYASLLVIFFLCLVNHSALAEWEKRHGIDFAEDVRAIGRFFVRFGWALLVAFSILIEKIKIERNKRTRMVYVAPAHGLTIGTYRKVRS